MASKTSKVRRGASPLTAPESSATEEAKVLAFAREQLDRLIRSAAAEATKSARDALESELAEDVARARRSI